MNEDLNSLLSLMPAGAFRDVNELNDFIQSQGVNQLYPLVSKSAFRDEEEFMSFASTLNLKKKKRHLLPLLLKRMRHHC